jgi:GntR family transcriptional regulator
MPHFPFRRLLADLADLIAKAPPGFRLPSEPELAKQMGVSRATLREAMRTFETQGLIRRRQGAGTFVVGKIPVIDSGLEVLESMQTLAGRINLDVTAGEITISEFLADDSLAAALSLPVGRKLVRVSRVMHADSRPVAYLEDTLPEDVLHAEELTGKFNGSVLDYLLQRGDPLTSSRADISAINAPAEVAKMLEIQRDDVLLQFVSKLYTSSGKVVDYSISYFLPGYFKFHVVRRVGALNNK